MKFVCSLLFKKLQWTWASMKNISLDCGFTKFCLQMGQWYFVHRNVIPTQIWTQCLLWAILNDSSNPSNRFFFFSNFGWNGTKADLVTNNLCILCWNALVDKAWGSYHTSPCSRLNSLIGHSTFEMIWHPADNMLNGSEMAFVCCPWFWKLQWTYASMK